MKCKTCNSRRFRKSLLKREVDNLTFGKTCLKCEAMTVSKVKLEDIKNSLIDKYYEFDGLEKNKDIFLMSQYGYFYAIYLRGFIIKVLEILESMTPKEYCAWIKNADNMETLKEHFRTWHTYSNKSIKDEIIIMWAETSKKLGLRADSDKISWDAFEMVVYYFQLDFLFEGKDIKDTAKVRYSRLSMNKARYEKYINEIFRKQKEVIGSMLYIQKQIGLENFFNFTKPA